MPDARPDTLLHAAQEVARVAGRAALAQYRAGVTVEWKPDGSPVTAADRAAEHDARDWISRHFPADGILGEELPTRNPAARRRWIVDPIDGTQAFIRGVPLWGTLVAVADGEDVLAGAMWFPALDEMICAAPGEGSWWNGGRAHVSGVDTLARATVLTTNDRFTHAAARQAGWRSLAGQAAVARGWGDCYGYLLLATGRAEVMVDAVMNPWDAAPLIPIVTEAGGVITDYAGRVTAFGGSIIATNAALAGEARRVLGAELPGAPVMRVAPTGVPRPAPTPARSTHDATDTLARLDFRKQGGTVTVVAQDAATGRVLMVAAADREAVERSAATGEMHYRSRTRGLWHKGATSGNTQRVVSLHPDCDGDVLLALVVPRGPACHTGAESCFASTPPGGPAKAGALLALDATIAARAKQPPARASGYTHRLLHDRNLRLKKLGEEMAEFAVACADADGERAVNEAADVYYHLMVALRAMGLGLADLEQALAARALSPAAPGPGES